MAELCGRFGVSRKSGYKWRSRYLAQGAAGLLDRPRKGSRKPNQTGKKTEGLIVKLRQKHPSWGPRKLKRRLANLGYAALPATSTFARILKRHGCVEPSVAAQHRPFLRFSRQQPNELWQMDFKGHFALQRGGRCHPLTILDDCSRYSLALQACADQQTGTVQQRLERVFDLYGLPDSILCDNGPPWGGSGPELTGLAVWLMRLGVRVLHGRPYHPQTQGKEERFHRTLQADLLCRHDWRDLPQTQQRFNRYRHLYNHDRPHEALDLAVPASRYKPSQRCFPSPLPPIEYDLSEITRPVKSKGEITFKNRFFYIGRAFSGLTVALRPTKKDGVFRVAFASFDLGLIDCSTLPSRPKGHYHFLQSLPPNV